MTKYGMALISDGSMTGPSTTHTVGNASPLSITCHKLNGRNFWPWSQSVLMFIYGRGKEDVLTGAATRPDSSDAKFKAWKAENNLVMSWLINYMLPEISENFLLYSSAKEIWDAVRETYSYREDTAELFAIESAVHDLRQDESSVADYYSALTRHWQKVDLIEAHEWKCTKDEELYQSIVENRRVFKFLMGLNNSLDDVCSRVLSTKPLPTLRASFSEADRKKAVEG